MAASLGTRGLRRIVLSVAGLAMMAGATGCQVDVGGQTLPSPYYLKDDIQYFPPGPWFKLQNEANAQKLYQEELAAKAPQQ